MVDFYTLPGTPSDVLTSEQVGTRRIAMDVAQTCFFEGRQGFVFREFDLAEGVTEVIRVDSPVDTIVQTFGAELVLGELRVELVTGGTESGTFETAIPVRPVNTMTTAGDYDLQVSFSANGQHTGGEVADLFLLNAGSPARQAQTAIATEALPFGFAPGVFYVRLINTNNVNAKGIFRARWEELP